MAVVDEKATRIGDSGAAVKLGVLDIGSNTVHVLVFDALRGSRPDPVADERTVVRLMQYLDEDGTISAEGVQALLDAARQAMRVAQREGVLELLVMVTSAVREATNAEEILASIAEITGVRARVLTGVEESALTFLAVRRWSGWSSGRLLNLDIGGGSFEVALGIDEEPDLAMSVPLGAGRLTKEYLRHDPPKKKELRELSEVIAAGIEPVVARVRELPTPDHVTATSKTFRSLARLAGFQAQERGNQLWRMNTDQLRDWVPRLAKLPAQQRTELPGITPERTYQVVAGAMVAEAMLTALGVERVDICPWALREGAMLRHLDRL